MAHDLSQFLPTFYEECFESLDGMEHSLLHIEAEDDNAEAINSIFRGAHSIKGGAATFGMSAVASFTHVMETLLDNMRGGRRKISPEDVSLLLESVDCVRGMLTTLKEGGEIDTASVGTVQARLEGALNAPVVSLESGVLSQKPKKETSTSTQDSRLKTQDSGDEITEHEFEALLDNLHGAGGAPGKNSRRSSVVNLSPQSSVLSPQTPDSRLKTLDSKSPTPDSRDEITDAEFERLLDDVQGSTSVAGGRTPGATDVQGSTSVAGGRTPGATDVHGPQGAPGKAVPARRAPHWRIAFRPSPNMLKTGNDPVRIFRELAALGEIEVQADMARLPPFGQMDPETCYLGWTVELESEAKREHLDEVFAWVEGDCELEIKSLESGVLSLESKTPGRESGVLSLESKDNDAKPSAAHKTAEPSADVGFLTPDSRLQTQDSQVTTPDSRLKTQDSRAAGEGTSIRVAIDKIDILINMVGELVITQSMLSQVAENFDMERVPALLKGLSQLERNTRELQENVMRIRMLPVSFAFSRLPRLVRDLSGKLGKQVELTLFGEQTEMDKTVMEKLGDPLVHLVRNALDHGLETPEARRAAGKPEVGSLTLNAYHKGGNVVIEIADDGAGLNKEKILKRARERGLVGADEQLTDEKIYELVCMPGFSTAENVSDVSGRGVGMDVVRRNIKSLSGSLEFASQPGKGTTIAIRLPLTLAILDGQIVRVGGEIYIIPLVSIIETIQIDDAQVNAMVGKAEVFRLRDAYLPIVRLYQVFNLTPRTTRLSEGLIVVVEGDGQRVGLFVDELLSQQQVVIKSLEANFRRVEGISGATILGDGTVALIVDVPGMVKLRDVLIGEAKVAAGALSAAA